MLANLAPLKAFELMVFTPDAADVCNAVNVGPEQEEREDCHAFALLCAHGAYLQGFARAHFLVSRTRRASAAKRDCSQAMPNSSRK